MAASGFRSLALRVLSAVAGAGLILVGLVLWILPVVPGLGLVLVGLPMVMAVHPRGRVVAARWRRQADAAWAALKARWRDARKRGN